MASRELALCESAPREPEPVVRTERLRKVFATRGGEVCAVDNVSFSVRPGQIVGLVGESGSGKSTVARLLLRLQQPTSGAVYFDGVDLLRADRRALSGLRRRAQMVFQNPYGSLLPHFSAAANVAEPLRVHRVGHKPERRAEALRLLELVGVDPRHADLYPRQFSGGQQQRIAIARALVLRPELLICDEPTSSLDVSIQAQILRLFRELHADLGFAALFISHNLAVVELMADEVLVMRQGKVVESGPTSELFTAPRHPYTRKLLDAVLPVRAESRLAEPT